MPADAYRYKFAAEVQMDDVEASLVLAILATESLHGEAQVRLDAGHFLDREQRTCVIDAATEVGRDFNRLFMGFLAVNSAAARLPSLAHMRRPSQRKETLDGRNGNDLWGSAIWRNLRLKLRLLPMMWSRTSSPRSDF